MANSMFNRGESGMTRGGIDQNLGPQAEDYSSLPNSSDVDPIDKTTPDGEREIDCAGKDADQDVCEIAKLEQEEREIGGNAT